MMLPRLSDFRLNGFDVSVEAALKKIYVAQVVYQQNQLMERMDHASENKKETNTVNTSFERWLHTKIRKSRQEIMMSLQRKLNMGSQIAGAY